MRAAAADREVRMKELCTVIFLAANSWLDIKKREISLILTVAYAGCGILCSILQGREIQDVLIPVVVSCWHWELCWIRKSIFRCYASDFFWRRSGPGSCL